MAGFDRERALWEFTLVEGLEGGRAALVMKLHHSLTDGIGGMEMAKNLFDLDPVAEAPEARAVVEQLVDTRVHGVDFTAQFHDVERWRARCGSGLVT